MPDTLAASDNLPLPPRPHRAVAAVLALTAAAALAVPAVIVTSVDRRPAIAGKVRLAPPRVVPRTQLPVVEPMTFVPVSREDAVAFNATIPFSTAPNPPARPFMLAGTQSAGERAVDCLAAAQLYEAGDDGTGERAVAQVIINRVRHPAFPKSICGVVFEGATRTTGCQFTFTCDGALLRHRFSDAAWDRARAIARGALTGSVFRPVGHATHYHTDWVVPYWSASLDKVTAVGTHLFFRWTGWWGTPAAFMRRIDPDEPVIAQLAAYSPAHRSGLDLALAAGAPGSGAVLPGGAKGGIFPEVANYPDTFIVTLDRTYPADELPALAARNCGDRAYCKFMVWTDARDAATNIPLTSDEIASMAFSYFRDRASGYDKPLWNCTVFARPNIAQCMRRSMIAAPSADKLPRASAGDPSGTVADPSDARGSGKKAAGAAPPSPATPPAPGVKP